MKHRNRATTILDDGVFLVELANPVDNHLSAGFLERRCAVSPATPRGRECVGAFVRCSTGHWKARVATRFDSTTGRDYCEVIDRASRLDAIVSLWQSRHNVCFATQA